MEGGQVYIALVCLSGVQVVVLNVNGRSSTTARTNICEQCFLAGTRMAKLELSLSFSPLARGRASAWFGGFALKAVRTVPHLQSNRSYPVSQSMTA